MRRDKLDRQLKRIHWKVVKRFFKRCVECKDDVKGEQMWYYRSWGNSGPGTLYWTLWVCRRCAPMMSDLFRLRNKDFDNVDYSAIEEEERQIRQQNEVPK